jgi:formamidopyrimidine-DNA glycosylase
MPELPEVQTIINDLNKKIKGDMIVDFWSNWPKAIKNLSLEKFKKEIKNRKILDVRRIGKNIFIDLSGDKTLYIHLKMTGHLLIKSQIQKPKSQINSNDQISKNKKNNYFNDRVNQYIHHIWKLQTKNYKLKTSYDKTLEFSDLRKFGKIVLDDTEKINNLKEIKSLGVDAMSSEFTFPKFSAIMDQKKNKKIRDILMDQTLIAGIGNIYLSEILFNAGILPIRVADKINLLERKKLFNSIKKILELAIKLRGTSDSDYRDANGAPGNFQKVLKVYRQTGKKCRICGTIIKRLKIGQRSAFFCSKCQN